MDDTRARFLAAIADRLGPDRIVELHLFSALRQGALETGVAVVAAEPRVEEPVVGETASDPATPAEHAAGRLEVFTARYRLTRKGPDRGKWLFEIAATADAPLPTVDAVARGVTLRSKDLTETERLTGEQLRALLDPSAGRTSA